MMSDHVVIWLLSLGLFVMVVVVVAVNYLYLQQIFYYLQSPYFIRRCIHQYCKSTSTCIEIQHPMIHLPHRQHPLGVSHGVIEVSPTIYDLPSSKCLLSRRIIVQSMANILAHSLIACIVPEGYISNLLLIHLLQSNNWKLQIARWPTVGVARQNASIFYHEPIVLCNKWSPTTNNKQQTRNKKQQQQWLMANADNIIVAFCIIII